MNLIMNPNKEDILPFEHIEELYNENNDDDNIEKTLTKNPFTNKYLENHITYKSYRLTLVITFIHYLFDQKKECDEDTKGKINLSLGILASWMERNHEQVYNNILHDLVPRTEFEVKQNQYVKFLKEKINNILTEEQRNKYCAIFGTKVFFETNNLDEFKEFIESNKNISLTFYSPEKR